MRCPGSNPNDEVTTTAVPTPHLRSTFSPIVSSSIRTRPNPNRGSKNPPKARFWRLRSPKSRFLRCPPCKNRILALFPWKNALQNGHSGRRGLFGGFFGLQNIETWVNNIEMRLPRQKPTLPNVRHPFARHSSGKSGVF